MRLTAPTAAAAITVATAGPSPPSSLRAPPPWRSAAIAPLQKEWPFYVWDAAQDEVRFVCEVRPALQFESLLETMFSLAEDGKTNRKGMPNPLRLAVIAHALGLPLGAAVDDSQARVR